MTIEEFNKTRWGVGMEAVIHSKAYGSIRRPVVSVDFDQALIGIATDDEDDEQLQWFRCENCDLIEQ